MNDEKITHLRYLISPNFLGRIRCLNVRPNPSSIHSPPTTKYAIPRKGFLPPINETVEKTIDLVPLNGATG
jgi:hypothetical protein